MIGVLSGTRLSDSSPAFFAIDEMYALARIIRDYRLKLFSYADD
jgi:hypothetical protein